MRRRDFIAGLGGAATSSCMWPGAASAQNAPQRPTIGILVMNAGSSVAPRVRGFLEALHALGYSEGRDFVLQARYADGVQDRLPALANELVRLKPDVFVAGSVQATFAAKQSSPATPIVCISLIDPIALGLVASDARPGGQVTGILATVDGLTGKQLEVARDALPGTARMGMLINPGNPALPAMMRDAEAAAGKLALTLVPAEVRVPDDLDGAFKALARDRVDMVWSQPDPMFVREEQRIAVLAAAARLPTIYTYRESVVAGGLMSYGVNLADSWRRAAYYVQKILIGTKAGDIPVELPTRFELVINLKTAKALNLVIPASFLLRADEVIE
jgi:putative ABC transport system substrate-binding protein